MIKFHAIASLICALLFCCGFGCATHQLGSASSSAPLIGAWERTDQHTEWGPAISRFIFREDGIVVNEIELIANKTTLDRQWQYTIEGSRIISPAWGERPVAYRLQKDELVLFIHDGQPLHFRRAAVTGTVRQESR